MENRRSVPSPSPELLFPATAGDAATLFGDGAGVTVFAGGTILMPALTHGELKPGKTLMLARAGLDGLSGEGGSLRIGAAVTVAALTGTPARALAAAAAGVADAEVRAAATVGGNLCAPPGREAPRGDLQAPLIALAAEVRSTGAGGERVEPVEEFLAGDRAARLVLEITIPVAAAPQGYAALRRPHAHSYTVLAAAAARVGGSLRLAVSGTGPTAVRCSGLEASGDPEDVLKDVTPHEDALASVWYRTKLLPVVVRRALAQLEDNA
jgi:aerobic carbon-monoxide dehydrogenase medium subunit